MTTPWLTTRMLGFDLETTAADPETARIVQACVGWADPATGGWEPDVRLANPGIPIPAEATEIHHITDADVAAAPDAEATVMWLVDTLEGAWDSHLPVVGFNVCYDLTVLDRESRRVLGRKLLKPRHVLDPFVLDKEVDFYRRGLRTLAATCQLYGVPLDNAHDAGADTFATVRLAYKLCAYHPRLNYRDLDELFDFQQRKYREQRLDRIAYMAAKGEKPDSLNTDWPIATWPKEKEEVRADPVGAER
jgi:DNA polymerase III subunit epsilon